MQHDPFGNLMDWGPVLEMFDDLEATGKLEDCQPGLVRILRYKGNWRLREEVLKRVGQLQKPCDELIFQILAILADDNIYFDARVLAVDALIKLSQVNKKNIKSEIKRKANKITEKLQSTPQPTFFNDALNTLNSHFDMH